MRVMPGFIAVIVEKTPEKTAGGIFLPETARKDRPLGTVAMVGADVSGFTEGDKVIFDTFAGTAIVIEDIEYRFLKQADIYAVL